MGYEHLDVGGDPETWEAISVIAEKKSGIEALYFLLDTPQLSHGQRCELEDVLMTVRDGWMFHLRQRFPRLTDTQWERIVGFLNGCAREKPAPFCYFAIIAEMGDLAECLAGANPWKKPGQRLMNELGIVSNWKQKK